MKWHSTFGALLGCDSLSTVQKAPVEVLGARSAGGGACFRVGKVAFDCGANPEGGELARAHFEVIKDALLADPIEILALSHFHLDHYGGAPELLKAYDQADIPLPMVVCTDITWRLLERSLRDARFFPDGPANYIRSVHHATRLPGIRLVKNRHSVPGSVAVLYEDGVRTIFYTGDFWKISLPKDFPKVDLCIVDSTGAAKQEPRGDKEGAVRKNIMRLVWDSLNKPPASVYVATFSTNLERICYLEDASKKLWGFYPQKEGSSIFLNTGAFRKDPKGLRDDRFVICTGVWGQGSEEGSSRMARSRLVKISQGEDDYYQLKKGDRVILSASMPIWNQGLMAGITTMCGRIADIGAEVVVDSSVPDGCLPYATRSPVHCSGHGSFPEIAEFLGQLRPKRVFATHGDEQSLEIVQEHCKKKRMGVVGLEGPTRLAY